MWHHFWNVRLGGTDAESLKNGIDGIFGENGSIPLTPADCHTKFIGCTSDGASVNFCKKTGLMTRFVEHRGWLIKIHCTNHRIELAVKDAVKESDFTNVDEFYIGVHILLKTLGKLKGKSNQRQSFKYSTLHPHQTYWYQICRASVYCLRTTASLVACNYCCI